MRARFPIRIAVTLLAGMALGTAPALAQQPSKPKCDTPEHRQFDFWLGDWEVTSPDGATAGTNSIRLILEGCVLHESWVGGGGSLKGQSFNIYSRADAQWYQTWVDDAGNILRLSGGMREGRMVLAGKGRTRDGKEVLHEIAWTALEDGRVEQHWRSSNDGGASWNDVFRGLYAKSAGS